MNLRKFYEIVAFALVLTILSPFAYQSLQVDTAIAAATSASNTIVVTLTVLSDITITAATNTTMSRNLDSVANTAVATSSWTVRTNAGGGYILYVRASSTPAMNSATSSIANYAPGGTDVPELWNPGAGTAVFGYSAFGTKVPTATWGTGAVCSGGTGNDPSTTLKYQNFKTTDRAIASSTATTTTAGETATVCYAVEQKGIYIPSGTYNATITATAIAQ